MADILSAIVPAVRGLVARHGLDAEDGTAADPFAEAAPVPQECLCRHALRPPLDGTSHVAFSPSAFLARLAVLIPRPRVNVLLYHGVLAPRAGA